VGAIKFMPVLTITKICKYCRTTVPREDRKILELEENDETDWVLEEGKIVVRRAKVSSGVE